MKDATKKKENDPRLRWSLLNMRREGNTAVGKTKAEWQTLTWQGRSSIGAVPQRQK